VRLLACKIVKKFIMSENEIEQIDTLIKENNIENAIHKASITLLGGLNKPTILNTWRSHVQNLSGDIRSNWIEIVLIAMNQCKKVEGRQVTGNSAKWFRGQAQSPGADLVADPRPDP
jgi:hypothetical protein